MKVLASALLYFLLAHLALAMAMQTAIASDIATKYSQLEQYVVASLEERALEGKDADARIHDKYRELGFDQDYTSLQELSDGELTYLMRAAAIVAHDLPQSGLEARMSEIFEVLRDRDALEDPHVRTMYRAWVRVRAFDQAASLRESHSTTSLTPIPEIRDPSEGITQEKSLLRLHPTEYALIRDTVEVDSGAIIIVGADPNCGWVDRAANDIFASPSMAEFFSDRALWLATHEQSLLELESIRTWNERFPAEMLIVESPAEWTLLKYRTTPTFYILEDERVVETLRGWEPETRARLEQIIYQGDYDSLESLPD